jgi:hypothetical protein
VTRDPPSGPYYLDAIFASIRSFAQDIEGGKRWLARADQTENAAWRFTFLREARASLDRAGSTLAAVTRRVSALGPAEALPPPLDRIHENVSAMSQDLARETDRLVELLARIAEKAPLGRA